MFFLSDLIKAGHCCFLFFLPGSGHSSLFCRHVAHRFIGIQLSNLLWLLLQNPLGISVGLSLYLFIMFFFTLSDLNILYCLFDITRHLYVLFSF